MKILNHILEAALIASTVIILSIAVMNWDDGAAVGEPPVDAVEYEDFPLMAWMDTEDKWDGSEQYVVKIKYRVFDADSRIWVYDEYGTAVHKQPYDRDPKDDGTPRDFTYSWRLYKSEWSEAISPGTYLIRVKNNYSSGLGIEITI